MLGAKPALSFLCLSRLTFDLKITSKARNSVFLVIENSASRAAVVDCFIGICLSACKWTDIISPGARVKEYDMTHLARSLALARHSYIIRLSAAASRA